MLMKHFLCNDVGGKHNVCGMDYVYCHLKLEPIKIIDFNRF
jgi:hypothetical protein